LTTDVRFIRRNQCAAEHLLLDRLELDRGPSPAPPLGAGTEHDPVSAPINVQSCAKRDRVSVRPHPFCDLPARGPGHQLLRSPRDARRCSIPITSILRGGAFLLGAPAPTWREHLSGGRRWAGAVARDRRVRVLGQPDERHPVVADQCVEFEEHGQRVALSGRRRIDVGAR
jgi:hypothetical protein